jgi:hypothetical protein
MTYRANPEAPLSFYAVCFYGLRGNRQFPTHASIEKTAVWQPTQVQFLYRHRIGRHYVRSFAAGKEKWASLKTKLLSVARYRMKDHLDAPERQKIVLSLYSTICDTRDTRDARRMCVRRGTRSVKNRAHASHNG